MPRQTDKGKHFSRNIEDYISLYNASHLLSKEVKRDLGLLIPVEVYLQDPWVAEQARQAEDQRVSGRSEWEPINTIDVLCEPDLMAGPTSARLAVLDRDADTSRLEEPVGWDREDQYFFVREKGKKVPLTKAHCDLPQFHQVNVWAIVQSILDMYEQTWILGRSVPWAFEGNRLVLVPHAGEMRNAFYDRSSKSIQFFYFHYKGKKILTCLSHDIIAHETGHAVLDGLRPYYNEDSSIQTSAFHEFVADLTAIMAAFLNNELRFQTLTESEGDLSRDQIISALAEEFGYYSYGRPYLRNAQDPKTIASVQNSRSPYDWSLVLTGTMFDILEAILAICKTTPKSNGKLPTLREAFSFACNRFRRVAFQPLDYLPPVDVHFSDYAQAVLRADELVEPLDPHGYRKAMTEIFVKRGIAVAEQEEPARPYFYTYGIDRLIRSRTDAYHFLNENRRQLCIPLEQDISIADLYQTDKTVMGGGKLPREIVLQYTWREEVDLKGKEFGPIQDGRAALLCGGTLIFDSRGNVLSWQRKPGAGKQETGQRLRGYCCDEQARGIQRREALLAYLRDKVSAGAI